MKKKNLLWTEFFRPILQIVGMAILLLAVYAIICWCQGCLK